MSENAIMARFCKCGDLHHLSRRFHNLSMAGRRQAVELMQQGIEAAKAIRTAKRRPVNSEQ